MYKNSLLISLSHIFQLLTQLVLVKVISNKFGLATYGSFAIFVAIINLPNQVFQFPLGNYFQLRFRNNNDNIQGLDLQLLSTSILTPILLASCALFITGKFSLYIIIYTISYTCWNMLFSSILTFLNAHSNHKLFAYYKISHNIVFLILLVWIWHSVQSLDMFLLSWSLLLIIESIFSVFVFCRISSPNLIETSVNNSFRNYWKKSYPLMIVALSSYVVGSGERFFIEINHNLETVGLYSSLYLLGSKPMVFSKGIIDTIYRPEIYGAGENKLIQKSIRRKWIFTVLIVFCSVSLLTYLCTDLYLFIVPREVVKNLEFIYLVYVVYIPFLVVQYYRRYALSIVNNIVVMRIDIISGVVSVLLFSLISLFTSLSVFWYILPPCFAFLLRLILYRRWAFLKD